MPDKNSSTHSSHIDELIYANLKLLANKLMIKERDNHTLSPTDLVHEAFVKLSGSSLTYNDEKHYFRTVACQMRRVLIDYARSKSLQKNNKNAKSVIFTDSLGLVDNSADFSIIDEAINELNKLDNRSAAAIDLVYFTSLTQAQTAKYLDISVATLERDLKFGRAFINNFIRNS